MDKIQAIFRTEAEELLSALERALLSFENDLSNMESVREIFRVMHTLKGSASMFGYESLSTFTHDLETIYDGIRSGKAKASVDILEITLESVDHIKKLMTDPALTIKANADVHQFLLTRIAGALTSQPAQISKTAESQGDEIKDISYYILFKPSPTIFNNGTNPLYLVDDLSQLGRSFIIPSFNAIPSLDKIISNHCYTNFEILLVSKVSDESIREVFLFVDDASEVQVRKLTDGDVLSNVNFMSGFEQVSFEKIARDLYGYENLAARLTRNTASSDTKASPALKDKKESTTIRVSSDKLDELMNLVSELVTSQARLNLLSQQHQIADLGSVSETMEKLTRRLRDSAFTICLVPIESLVVRFQRLVRDLAKELNKEIHFVTEGTDTELDRSVIEKVTDPILHILRNCIDHGMELPEHRISAGKKSRGTIVLKAHHSGTNVMIEIRDDGRGIDPQKIRAKAIERGMITPEQAMTDAEIINLIFAPGFSTAAEITDVSGRGVGMDIVKRNIEGIHGEVQVESKVGVGTCITIRLPLTLSILDGMLVQIGAAQYLLPLSVVQTCHEIESRKVTEDVAQKHVFNDELLPVFNLHAAFDCSTNRNNISHVIKIHYPDFPVGISVDGIIGEYQAVMKPLGDMYKGRDEFSGATILGDGTIALVLDTTTLIRTLISQELQTVRNN